MTLHLEGEARQRGRQHGEARRDRIRERVERAPPWAGSVDPWWRAIAAAAPTVADELLGVADGAGCDLAEIVRLNSFEAEMGVGRSGCTALATTDGGHAIVAQNWDADDGLAGTLDIHRHTARDGLDAVVLASDGGLGWVGMNEAGLALVTTDLLTRGVRLSLPSQAVRRLVLERRTVAEAVALLEATPAPGGRTYLLGDATGDIAVVELCAEHNRPFVMRPSRWTAHTNHALHPAVVEWEAPEQVEAIYPSSRARLARAQALLAGDAEVEAVLRDHDGLPLSLCRHPDPGEPTSTAASVVLDCAARTARITLGRPCASTAAELSL